MSQNELPFISVVIPTHNRKEMLPRALEGLAAQTYPEDRYEVVVVDDGSTDGTAELLRQFSLPHLRLRHIASEARGPAAARNLGLQQAGGEVILFTGDDCIADADLLLHHGRRHSREDGIAVLGYVDWHPECRLDSLMHFLGHYVQTAYPRMGDPERVGAGHFYTSNVSARKEHLLQAGGFDEDFRWAAYEDVELGLRLAGIGVRLVLERAAITYHHHQHTWQSIAGRQRAVGRAAVVFARKHPELRHDLGVDNLANPEFFEHFTRALLDYWHLQGVAQEMSGQTSLGPEDSEIQLDFPAWLNSTMARHMTRLLERTRVAEREAQGLRRLVETKERLIGQIEARAREQILRRDEQIRQRDAGIRRRDEQIRQRDEHIRYRDELIHHRNQQIRAHEEHVRRLRIELEGLEAFARRIRAFPPYRVLSWAKRALRRLLRPPG